MGGTWYERGTGRLKDFAYFQKHQKSSPFPYPHPQRVSRLGSMIRPSNREWQKKEEASELGLGSGLTSASALATT